MIPLHRSAFGLETVIESSLPVGGNKSLQQLEEAYARATGCAGTVWLPSARAGICWALRASLDPSAKVIGPAFTCTVVHEAMVRSGRTVRLIDAGDDFLMDDPALLSSLDGNYGLVLSEVYGHPYDLAHLEPQAARSPMVRIVDMAMSVPYPTLFQRLGARDFGVISFGNGSKSMFGGWGAIGFAPNALLAREVRKLRDSVLGRGGFGLLAKRSSKMFLRTAAHYPAAYSLAWKLWYESRPALSLARRLWHRGQASTPAEPPAPGFPAAWRDDRSLAPEWSLPSTRLDRGLAFWNLERADRFHEARLALARRYWDNLAGAKGILCPKESPHALSHFTVRLAAELRNPVKQRLLQSGIYTISLWTFPQHLDRREFPNTFRLSSEVVNLPLAPWMSMNLVDRVCEQLIQCVDTCSRG
jgi:dTDP-4-amino-4,6-dideoxygalactose transaminase